MKYKEFMDACERDLFVETIARLEGGGVEANAVDIAHDLGISPATVFRKLQKHGISRKKGLSGRYQLPPPYTYTP